MLIVLLSFPLSSLAWQASEVERNKAIAKSFFEEVIDQWGIRDKMNGIPG
jgi:hypothetical protein